MRSLKKHLRSLKKYLRFISISFRTGTAYRIDYLSGVLNIALMVAINIILWQSLYRHSGLENSIQHRMMVTYLIFSIIFQGVFAMDEFFIQARMRDGSILYYLLKPMSFRMYIFSSNLGRAFFNLLMLFVPAVLIVGIFFDIVPPASLWNLLYYVVSAGLGYIVLFSLNFIVWTFALERLICMGYVMLKNALVVVLSGALVPLWFMPEEIAKVLGYLPFQYIYYFPLSIYLGIVPRINIIQGLLLQLAWAAIFAAMGQLAWKISLKSIVIQGG